MNTYQSNQHNMGQRSASVSGYNQHSMGGQHTMGGTHHQQQTMGGSRYNLHQAPLSPSAGSYYGGGVGTMSGGSVYNHQLTSAGAGYHGGGAGGAGSVYHGYGSRRGSMQSLVAASGTCTFCLSSLCLTFSCLPLTACH